MTWSWTSQGRRGPVEQEQPCRRLLLQPVSAVLPVKAVVLMLVKVLIPPPQGLNCFQCCPTSRVL